MAKKKTNLLEGVPVINGFVDVVLVLLEDKTKTIAIAPLGIGIKERDEVSIVTESAVVSGEVLSVTWMDAEDDVFKFMLKALGLKTPNSVLSIQRKVDVEWGM